MDKDYSRVQVTDLVIEVVRNDGLRSLLPRTSGQAKEALADLVLMLGVAQQDVRSVTIYPRSLVAIQPKYGAVGEDA
jgi:hypothetical protein